MHPATGLNGGDSSACLGYSVQQILLPLQMLNEAVPLLKILAQLWLK